MTPFSSLWLPILLSAVIVFIASSIIHMVLPWHKSDCPKVPNEDKVMDALRSLAIPPGDYMVPRPSSREEMRSPAFAEKIKRGPVLMLTVWPGGSMSMGTQLAQWFLYSVVVGGFAAYVAGRALPPGAAYREVFGFVGVTAFVGYSVALWQLSIWYRRAWLTTIKATLDGLIYALLTAGTFGWLWPRLGGSPRPIGEVSISVLALIGGVLVSFYVIREAERSERPTLSSVFLYAGALLLLYELFTFALNVFS